MRSSSQPKKITVSEPAKSSDTQQIAQDFLNWMEKFGAHPSDEAKLVRNLAKNLLRTMQIINQSNQQTQPGRVEKFRAALLKLHNKCCEHGFAAIYAGELAFENLLSKLLYHLAEKFPINEEDLSSLDPIEPDDRFFIMTGYQFSLRGLIEYNRLRPPIKDLEKNGKFLLNPALSATPFSMLDHERLILMAIEKGEKLDFLSDDTVPVSTTDRAPRLFTPKECYTLFSIGSQYKHAAKRDAKKSDDPKLSPFK